MSHSRSKRGRSKPRKPRPDFPLFIHGRDYQRWCKKVAGKLHYFGKVADDPDGSKALALWNAQRDDLLAGRRPRPRTEGLTVLELVNRFLNAKRIKVADGRHDPRGLVEYKATCARILAVFDKARLVEDLGPDDFDALLASYPATWNVVTRGVEVQRARAVFNFAHSRRQRLIPAPVMFGESFCGPTKRERRRHAAGRRADLGEQVFAPEEIRAMLAAADPCLKAAILLGINAGMGNLDVAELRLTALDLDGGWLTYPRLKTGEERKAALWSETVEALREAIARRPEPKDPAHQGHVFLTRDGRLWVRFESKKSALPEEAAEAKIRSDKTGYDFHYLLKRLGLRTRGFYCLRRTFRTIADAAGDDRAANLIMGHASSDMASVYVQRIEPDRLRRIAEYVRGWLYAVPDGPGDQDVDVVPFRNKIA